MESTGIFILMISLLGSVDAEFRFRDFVNNNDNSSQQAGPCPGNGTDFIQCCNALPDLSAEPRCCADVNVFVHNVSACCNVDVTLNPICCEELLGENIAACCITESFADVISCCLYNINYNPNCCTDHLTIMTDVTIKCCANDTIFNANEKTCCDTSIKSNQKCCADLFPSNQPKCCADSSIFNEHDTECCETDVTSNYECCADHFDENKAACCANNTFPTHVYKCCNDDLIFVDRKSECCAEINVNDDDPIAKCSTNVLIEINTYVILVMSMFLMRM